MNNLVDIVPWLTDIAYSFGYPGIAVLVALGYLHLPIPTELTLPLAGFLVGQGRFSFVSVLLVTTVAGVAVSVILYLLGFWIGEEPLRRFVRRFGRFVFLEESDLDKASEVFERHGGKAILIGRFIPGVTTFISIPAGIKRMPIYGVFMVFTVLDSIVWNAAFIGLGWALGSQWTLVERYASIVDYVVLATLAVLIIWFVWRRWNRRGN
jgi:membrane protein DedA with SNARE-associated domain